jgi:hypothetical protein
MHGYLFVIHSTVLLALDLAKRSPAFLRWVPYHEEFAHEWPQMSRKDAKPKRGEAEVSFL